MDRIPDYISKAFLSDLMEEWGSGAVSTEDMSFWCCNNYAPGAQVDDPDVPLCQQNAIHVVVQVFENQANDGAITAKREGWERAVEFLNCTPASFEQARALFEAECGGLVGCEPDCVLRDAILRDRSSA